jgi:osmotically-inducible protein OsmY
MGIVASSESDRLAQLRAMLSADPTLDASGVNVTFRNGAVHLSGVMHDEKAWFALINVAGTFARAIVDEIEVRRK